MGHQYQVLKQISDHYVDVTALKGSDEFIKSHGRNLQSKNTTRGCKLEVEYKDGNLTWIPSKDIKPSNPVECAEYMVAKKMDNKPAFKCWVKDIICRRD